MTSREQAGICADEDPPVVIVGSGPVGIRVADELVKREASCKVMIFGNEPWNPYDRVRLSSLLAGEIRREALDIGLQIQDNPYVQQYHNCPVIAINRQAATVEDIKGGVYPYSSLVLATGSRPHIPVIPGVKLPGVFTFRDMNDALQLMARRASSHHTIVLGGGLLGLEAARAMQQRNTRVTVIEHSTRLMYRQLDDASGAMLRELMMSLGIRVVLNDGVREILGEERVNGVRLHSGREIRCDTIVLSTGIHPNTELAMQSGLSIGRGIRVNDHMQTQDSKIYAVGECSEHREQIYGLVAPGFEQAAVAAHSILGGTSRYQGSIISTRLKVIQHPVFSMGTVGDEVQASVHRTHIYERHSGGIYRKLVTRKGRIVGAISLGDWPETGRLQEAITRQRYLWPWQMIRFRREGMLWPEGESNNIASWPTTATVCNCTGITRGTLSEAISSGCNSVACLTEKTGASSVCGSCRPLLAGLLGQKVDLVAEKNHKSLLGLSVFALLASLLVIFSMPVPFSTSVHAPWHVDVLWRDGQWKQVTGFSLLGLSLIGLLLSLRKRWRWISFGEFSSWRLVHSILGALTLIMLLGHTGLRLGDNLNYYLMVTFLGITLAGAAAGGAAALQHTVGSITSRRLRKWTNRLHTILFWPLPALLGFHIVSVYYF